jgi:hypothetical protein
MLREGGHGPENALGIALGREGAGASGPMDLEEDPVVRSEPFARHGELRTGCIRFGTGGHDHAGDQLFGGAVFVHAARDGQEHTGGQHRHDTT